MTQRSGWWCAIAAVVLTCVLLARGAHAADDFVVVANDTVAVQSLTHDAAKAILSGRMAQWKDGHAVIIVLPPRENPAATWMCDSLLEIPERVYRRFLLEQVYRGSARAPVQTRSLPEAAQIVAGTQGAITVLPRALIGAGAHAVTVAH